MKNPTEEKYRVLKKSNKAIAAKIMSLKPQEKLLELLKLLGYNEIDADISAFVGEYYMGLMAGSQMIGVAVEDIKMLSMSEEERKKILLMRKEKAAFYAEKKEKDKRKKELLDVAEARKKDMQNVIHTEAAQGKKINYGATLIKFEPPKEAKGG